MRWYGYVSRNDENDLEKCMDYEVEGVRPSNRPKKTWNEVMDKDC